MTKGKREKMNGQRGMEKRYWKGEKANGKRLVLLGLEKQRDHENLFKRIKLNSDSPEGH